MEYSTVVGLKCSTCRIFEVDIWRGTNITEMYRTLRECKKCKSYEVIISIYSQFKEFS